MKLAIITGADGGMGTEITRAVALAGYKVIMACLDKDKAEQKRQLLMHETGSSSLEVLSLDLSSLKSVSDFARRILERGEFVTLLMNNAGTMETGGNMTEEGLDGRVRVN